MAAKFIPVEEFTDYQPWQFTRIEEGSAVSEMIPADVQPEILQETIDDELEVEDAEPALQLPTAEDIGRIYHDAHREGYEAGLVEGLEAGHAEGFEAGRVEGFEAGQKKGHEQAVAEAKPLAELFSSFSKAAEVAQQGITQDVIRLAFDIARQMLREAIKANPEVVLTIVQAAIESMPQGVQHPHIHLHPEDALLVRSFLKDEFPHAGWKVQEDHHIERGGCRIECTTAELDATLPSRWRRISAALGQDHSWLENGR